MYMTCVFNSSPLTPVVIFDSHFSSLNEYMHLFYWQAHYLGEIIALEYDSMKQYAIYDMRTRTLLNIVNMVELGFTHGCTYVHISPGETTASFIGSAIPDWYRDKTYRDVVVTWDIRKGL